MREAKSRAQDVETTFCRPHKILGAGLRAHPHFHPTSTPPSTCELHGLSKFISNMAPSLLQQRRTHNTLLFQKLLNLRDGASPFTLLLDNLEQRSGSVVREFVRRAKVSLLISPKGFPEHLIILYSLCQGFHICFTLPVYYRGTSICLGELFPLSHCVYAYEVLLVMFDLLNQILLDSPKKVSDKK
jgi:hypothetical protein